jgi:HEAT repeat protein
MSKRLAAPAVPRLTELLASDNDVVVHHTIQALAAIGPASRDAVAALIGLLQGIGPDSPAIHTAHAWAAVSALGAIGPAAHEAIPALQQCLGRDTGDELLSLIKLSATEAIWHISGDTEIPLRVATAMLIDDESNIRCEAADLLGKLGPAARPAIAEIQRLAYGR